MVAALQGGYTGSGNAIAGGPGAARCGGSWRRLRAEAVGCLQAATMARDADAVVWRPSFEMLWAVWRGSTDRPEY